MIYTRRVTRIIDGDTFEINIAIQGTRFIRVAGLNAPELNRPGGIAAKNRLAAKFLGKRVEITPVSRSYGRLVAKVRRV